MRMRTIITTLLVGWPAVAGYAQYPTNFATLVSDGAWTWYNDPRALFHNGKLYVGYVRAANSKTALNVFDLATGQTSNLWYSGFTQLDDHNNPGLLSKQDGRLLAIYSRHLSDQYFAYRRSTSTDPAASTDWAAEQTIPASGASMTYANPFQLLSEGGKIYNFCRNTNFNPTVFTSTDGGSNWSSAQLFIKNGNGGSIRPYVKYASDYTNRIDFLYTDGHPRDVDNSLYHLYYQTNVFHKTDGTFLKNYSDLPILHDSGERGSVIYQYSATETNDYNDHIATGRAWNWEIAYQSNGAPVCVFTVQRDGADWTADRIYYYYARWTGAAWQKRFIAHAGRPLYSAEDDYAGGICLDPQDPNVIYISSNASDPFNTTTTNATLRANERYELWRGVTGDGGLTFAWTQITSNSTVDNLRPYVPRRNGGEPCVLWFRGAYTSYTSYSCSIVGLFSSPVPQTNGLPSGTWINDGDGLWSEGSNWANGIVADGAGNTADFSALDITAGRTVTLDSPRTISTLRFGDVFGGENWSLVASNGAALTLASPASIVVAQNTATLAVPLAGSGGFTKSGPGTLVLAASNSLSGPLNLDRGIDGNNDDGATRIAHPGAIANVSSVNIRNTSVGTAGGATLQLDGAAGNILVTQPMTNSCRNNSTRPTIQNLAGTNTLAGFMALIPGGNMFNLQSDAGLLVLSGTNQYVGSLTAGRTYAFSGAGDFLVSGPILNAVNTAPISLTKSGAGTLRLNAANLYGNGTTINGGTLLVNGSITGAVTVASGATLGGVGTIRGTVTVQDGGVLSPGDPLLGGAGVGTLTISNLVLQAGAVLQYELGTNSDTTVVSSNLTAAGTLNVADAGGFGAGAYTLFTYGKTLTYNGLSIGAAPAGFNYSVDTGTVGQVRLIVTPALTAWELWQLQYFGCTNCPQAAADADADGDGFSNTNEFLAGTVPTNSASAFRILALDAQGDDVLVTWQCAAGRTNAVQAVSGDYSTNYADITGPIALTGPLTNFTDVGAAGAATARFYRIRLVP
jgi:autotransporter-associated beta strand protein